MSDPLRWVCDAAGVAEVAQACRAADVVALDLEFASADRFRPELALIQVAWREGDAVQVVLIDAVAVDARPVVEALAGGVEVVVHAARQDLQILADCFELRIPRLFDTQIAAAFVGLGDQIGYGRLVEAVAGQRIDKAHQFTDWLKRPLSREQLHYAADDVRHLLGIADELARRLVAVKRRDWVDEECRALTELAFAASRRPSLEQWLEVGGASALDAPSRTALRRLAAWRHERAVADNLPPSWLAADKVLIDWARARPRDQQEVERLRGLGRARSHAAEIAAAFARAQADYAAGDVPSAGERLAAPSARVQLWEEIILAMVQLASEETGIAVRWLATRSDAEALARLIEESIDGAAAHPLLATWRRHVVGDALLQWFGGDAALHCDPRVGLGIRLVRN